MEMPLVASVIGFFIEGKVSRTFLIGQVRSDGKFAMAYLCGHGLFHPECCGGHLKGNVEACVEMIREKRGYPQDFTSGAKWR